MMDKIEIEIHGAIQNKTKEKTAKKNKNKWKPRANNLIKTKQNICPMDEKFSEYIYCVDRLKGERSQ